MPSLNPSSTATKTISSIAFSSIVRLPFLRADGATQMAIDTALLDYCSQNTLDAETTLFYRVYTWQEPTWSLGRFQKQDALEALLHSQDSATQPVVKRPTGGRALLHQDDISFCFATQHPALLKQSVSQSYCVFQTLLRQTLNALDIPLQAPCGNDANKRSDYHLSTHCMDSRLGIELASTSGEKLCGMAQARTKHGLIQHGAAFLKPYDFCNTTPDARRFEATLTNIINAAYPLATFQDVNSDAELKNVAEPIWKVFQDGF